MAPEDAEGADLTGFLQGLNMSLTIHDRSRGDRTRAVQLINKTNQFNLNGRRVTDDDVGVVLGDGGKLYTALLEDRTGSHGEIFSCLIDHRGTVQSLVMSCRVFQRRVEHAFFTWLAARNNPKLQLAFAETPRNEPIQRFLEDPAFRRNGDGMVSADLASFAHNHAGDLSLFTIVEPS
jgi:FkbH-like protein